MQNESKLDISMLSNKPVSTVFGLDRGLPIDRYYIEKFLFRNKAHVRGSVLEVGDSVYTKKFGEKRTKKSYVLRVNRRLFDSSLVGDLATGRGIPDALVDCFILTQTLPFIYDIHSAMRNSLKVVKPGGILLITVPGITQISRYDMDRWGHYWSFTEASLSKLLREVVPKSRVQIQTYGNVKTAACFLYGLASDELSRNDLDHHDPDYQIIISAVVKKPPR